MSELQIELVEYLQEYLDDFYAAREWSSERTRILDAAVSVGAVYTRLLDQLAVVTNKEKADV